MSQFMRAHGYLPGPTQRPVTAGAISGLLATLGAAPIMRMCGATVRLADELGMARWGVFLAYLLAMAVAGAVYGRVFGRSANDRRGGWLFGISYGFLVWLVGPVTILQWVRHAPIATGMAGMGLFGAHVVYGVLLGLLFPRVHQLIQRKLRDVMPG